MPEFGKPAGISLELFRTFVIDGPPPPPDPPVAPKVVNWRVIEAPLFAVTRILATWAAFVKTPNIVPTGRLLLGMGADDPDPEIACNVAWSRAANPEAPVRTGITPALALPCGVRLVPDQRISPPEAAVAPVSRFSD